MVDKDNVAYLIIIILALIIFILLWIIYSKNKNQKQLEKDFMTYLERFDKKDKKTWQKIPFW